MELSTGLTIFTVLLVLYFIYNAKRKKDKKKNEDEPTKNPSTPTPKPDISVGLTPVANIGGGFIWKPISESRGGIPVVLTPASWPEYNVALYHPNGKKISGRVECVGRTNPDKMTYFFHGLHSDHLPQNTVIEFSSETTQESVRYKIPYPTQRY